MKELEFIQKFKKANSRELNYLALDLITESYNPNLILELAKKNGINQRLGYLAEVAFLTLKENKLDNNQNLTNLVDFLYQDFDKWRFLNPNLPNYGKFILKENKNALNLKWKVYSRLDTKELSDWIDLYITEDYAKR